MKYTLFAVNLANSIATFILIIVVVAIVFLTIFIHLRKAQFAIGCKVFIKLPPPTSAFLQNLQMEMPLLLLTVVAN